MTSEEPAATREREGVVSVWLGDPGPEAWDALLGRFGEAFPAVFGGDFSVDPELVAGLERAVRYCSAEPVTLAEHLASCRGSSSFARTVTAAADRCGRPRAKALVLLYDLEYAPGREGAEAGRASGLRFLGSFPCDPEAPSTSDLAEVSERRAERRGRGGARGAAGSIMLAAPPVAEDLPVTRIGGRPLGTKGFRWPTCRTCGGPLRFLAQVRLADLGDPAWPDGFLLLFACAASGGGCAAWRAEGGANTAVVVRARGLAPVDPPRDGLLLERVVVSFVADRGGAYTRACRQRPQDVVGQLGGAPRWIQGDQTPECECGTAMRFVAALDESHGRDRGLGFGDAGCGYAFLCPTCRTRAKLLSQCC